MLELGTGVLPINVFKLLVRQLVRATSVCGVRLQFKAIYIV